MLKFKSECFLLFFFFKKKMFLFHNPIIRVFQSSCWLKQCRQWAIFLLLHEHQQGGKKRYRQRGSQKSGDGNTLFNDDMYFVLKVLPVIYSTADFILRDPTAFLGDDEVSVQRGSRTVSGSFDQTCFPLSLAHN